MFCNIVGGVKGSALDDGCRAYERPSSRPEAGLGDATQVSLAYPPRRGFATRNDIPGVICHCEHSVAIYTP